MGRKSLFAGAVVVVVGVTAAGVAYAAIPGGDGTIQGCYTKVGGILRLVDSTSQCKNFENPVSWSQKGQKGDPGTPGTPGTNGTNGAAGFSPTVTQLPLGDPNCLAGGAAITDAAGSTAYVCSGQNGQAGADGQPFSGTFTSPNGEYSISVTDAGITMQSDAGAIVNLLGDALTVQSGSVAVDADSTIHVQGGTDVSVRAGSNLTVDATSNIDMRAGTNATVRAGAGATVRGDQSATVMGGATTTLQAGGITNITGGLVRINDAGCHQAARVGDLAVGVAPFGGGAVQSQIFTGSVSVCIG